MEILIYSFAILFAVILGQIVSHLNKKLPPVVKEEITYKEFFKSLKKDFCFEIKYSFIFSVLFSLLIYINGVKLITFLYMFVIFALAIVTSIDIRYQLIPDEVHILIAILGFINLLFNLSNFVSYILGALVGGGVFLVLGLLSLLIFKKEGMGFGDVKLMASLGFLFGLKNILVITLVSFVFGAIVGGIILIVKKDETDGYIAFGPFIALGAVSLMFISSSKIIDIYISFCSWLGMQMTDILYFIIEKFNILM